MAVMKRATKKLHDAGFTTLEVCNGLWGYRVRDTRFRRQRGIVETTVAAIVEAVLVDGYRPVELNENNEPVQR